MFNKTACIGLNEQIQNVPIDDLMQILYICLLRGHQLRKDALPLFEGCSLVRHSGVALKRTGHGI